MLVKEVDVSRYEDYADHEKVLHCIDEESGLNAIIAIHSTRLGPAVGGCRMRPYASFDEAVTDALRLSRGMTYKSAMVHLPMGGGKSVIIGDPQTEKSEALLRAMGRFVNTLEGKYLTAEDSGIRVQDLLVMAKETRWVSGFHQKKKAGGEVSSGDPSPVTALGVYEGIKAALDYKFGKKSVAGVRIAVQGVGNVGANLVRMLAADGAELVISDVDHLAVNRLVDELDIKSVPAELILEQDVDILAPCAMGGVVNADSLKVIKASIIAGAANNQLSRPEIGCLLRKKDILYAPDYVINAGGIIDVYFEESGYDYEKVMAKVRHIGDALREIFQQADERKLPTHQVADEIAEKIFMGKSAVQGLSVVA